MDRILPMHSVGFCKLPGGGGIDDRRGSCPDSVSGGAPPARQSSLDSVLSISRALRGLQFSWDTKQLLTPGAVTRYHFDVCLYSRRVHLSSTVNTQR